MARGGFISELRRRKVIRVGLVYAVVAWAVIQVADTTFEPLQLPGWTVTFVILLAVVGFPVALVLAWAFERTPEGVRRDAAIPEPAADTSPDLGDRLSEESRSVAVLPFMDMSPEQDQGYLCEGIAEEILNVLAKVDQLKVVSRMASFRFRDGGGDVHEIGRLLNVGTLLEGSVRKAGNRLRVTAQLIDVRSGYHLWSERFDREMQDVFAIQDEIARKVAEALQVRLTPGGTGALAGKKGATTDVEAYDYYLRAWHYFHRFEGRAMRHAAALFARAIEADRDYSRAWAGKADAHAFLYMYWECGEENREQAHEASLRALELCPDLAENHSSRGLALMLYERWDEAADCFERAMELEPGLYEAAYFYARACVHQGRLEQAVALFRRAAEARPEDYQSLVLAAQFMERLGDREAAREAYAEGLERARQALELSPDETRALYLGASALLHLGHRDEAMAWAERAEAQAPDEQAVLFNLGFFYAAAGDRDRALAYFERADLGAAGIGLWMRNDPDFDSLRDDQRFRALLDRAGTCG